MDLDTFRLLRPKAFLDHFVRSSVRPDGRSLNESRSMTCRTDVLQHADGSSLVSLGDTKVLCSIRAEIAKPTLQHPDKGFIVVNLEMPPLCAAHLRPGPPQDLAQQVSYRLQKLIDDANIFNNQSLCISRGHQSWLLHCDLTCLQDAGNIMDASCVALFAALRQVKLPVLTILGTDIDQVVIDKSKPRSSIALNCFPVSSTFAVFDDCTLLFDPLHTEEPVVDSHLTVVLDNQSGILAVWLGSLASGASVLALPETGATCGGMDGQQSVDDLPQTATPPKSTFSTHVPLSQWLSCFKLAEERSSHWRNLIS